jgi:hypothetical protein
VLGDLSSKYESNGDPATVSSGWGDAGGVSYGCYQLASNTGSADSFVRWLRNNNHPAGNILGQHTPGSREFSAAWVYCAKNIADFGYAQHNYIAYAYFEPAVELLAEAGFHIENHQPIMADVVWSRAVQYGTGYIVEMFEDAVHSLGYENLSYVDAPRFDADMIKAVYLNVCMTEEWTNGSPALREGLYNRFQNECDDALIMLEG